MKGQGIRLGFRDLVRVEWELRVWWERDRRAVREERVVEREEGPLRFEFWGRDGIVELGLGFWEGREG